MRIEEAMDEIDWIRQSVSQAQTFDGIRALPTLGSALLAFAAAATLWLLAAPQTRPIAGAVMGILFGGGQCLSAGLLYWHLERQV